MKFSANAMTPKKTGSGMPSAHIDSPITMPRNRLMTKIVRK